MGAVDRIRADPDELDSLATKIAMVRSDLETAEEFFEDPAVGSAAVLRALREFNDAWSQRRGALVKLLGDSEGLLRSASGQFREADRRLAGAFDGGEGAQPAGHSTRGSER